MLDGFGVFHRIFGRAEGGGPFFVNDSCGGCHVENGRGPIRFGGRGRGFSALVVKISEKQSNPDGSPRDVRGIGGVLQDNSLSGRRRFQLELAWQAVRGTYPDGKQYRLRRPSLSFRIRGRSRRGIKHSLRMSPPIIGPGLLDEIPEEVILELADPDDLDGDGISGRPNYVIDRRTGELAIGRFGFKAGNPSLEQQSLGAFFNEMGVTNYLFPGASNDPIEFDGDDLTKLLFYQRLAGVPRARNQDSPEVILGKGLFQQIGCDSCHRMTVSTGPSADPELANQTFHPFTDLLLHDMGRGLADRRAEFQATGREWRTTPLFGLGFSETISNVNPSYLHDGRARTIEEAILWHGGESKKSRAAFKALSAAERAALIAFLRSL